MPGAAAAASAPATPAARDPDRQRQMLPLFARLADLHEDGVAVAEALGVGAALLVILPYEVIADLLGGEGGAILPLLHAHLLACSPTDAKLCATEYEVLWVARAVPPRA